MVMRVPTTITRLAVPLLCAAAITAGGTTLASAQPVTTPPAPASPSTDADPGEIGEPEGYVRQVCGGRVRICTSVEFNSFNPAAHDVSYISARLDGGISRVGHFQFFGPHGVILDGVNRGWGPGEVEQWSGYQQGNTGNQWCARFWEGANGNWIDVTGPICVSG